MKSPRARVLTFMATAIVLLGTVAVAVPSGTISAQDEDAAATISALQTQVADLQTQVAENEPTPTATPAPRGTVTAEPRVLTDGLELLYYYTVDRGSSIALLGEVRNTTDQWRDTAYLRIVFLDGDGNILETTDARPALATVGPGETMPFEASVSGDIAQDGWQTEEITACDWGDDYLVSEGYGVSPTLELQDVEEIERSTDRLRIEGKVLNSGTTAVERAHIKAFVYLPDGRYAGLVRTWLDVPVPPGKTARFELNGLSGFDFPGLELPGAGDDYTYELWVGTEPSARAYSC